MSTLLRSLLLVLKQLSQLLFPLSADEQTIETSTPHSFTQKLFVRDVHKVTVLSHFHDPEISAAVHLAKFHNHQRATMLLSTLLAHWLTAHAPTGCIVLPVPLSSQRQKTRGYNQVERIIANAKKSVPSIVTYDHVLIRTKNTVPQTTLKRSERLMNVAGAFAANFSAAHLVKDQHVIIVDDVMTTGATLTAAKAALSPLAPASISCVAITH